METFKKIGYQQIIDKVRTAIDGQRHLVGGVEETRTVKWIGRTDVEPLIELVQKMKRMNPDKAILFPAELRPDGNGRYGIEGVKKLLKIIEDNGGVNPLLDGSDIPLKTEEQRRCPEGVKLLRSDSLKTMDEHFEIYGSDEELKKGHPDRLEYDQVGAMSIPVAAQGFDGVDSIELTNADDGQFEADEVIFPEEK